MGTNAKHRRQSSGPEIQAVEAFVHSIRDWQNIQHALDQMRDRVFDEQQVKDTLAIGDMVEVHANHYPDIRVVMRYDVTPTASCVVVASIVNHKVITVWFNAPSDTHDTLNTNNYRWQVDLRRLMQLIKEGKPVKI